jgi:hypothetical protein
MFEILGKIIEELGGLVADSKAMLGICNALHLKRVARWIESRNTIKLPQ